MAENAATVDLAKAPQHDKADTMALGERQGDLRGLLDKLIQKASGGKMRLPPEPDNRDLLPEEKAAPAGAGAVAGGPDVGEKIDEQELQQDLIGTGEKPKPKPPASTKPGAAPTPPPADDGGDHDLALVGGRMARARQRLAINDDPGPVTQEIQHRILDDLDKLIEEARKKEAQQQNTPPKPGDGDPQQQQAKAKPGEAKQPQPAQAKAGEKKQDGGKSPAQTAGGTGNAAGQVAGADAAKQEGRMWGSVPPRERQAIIESTGEKPLDKYKVLVEDYERNMSTRAKPPGQ